MNDRELITTIPSKKQLSWQQKEFIAFIHFTVNAYTDREWGDGTESESIFDPKEFSAKQWVDAVRSAGMRGLILTCKHHDGFCLWHSDLTEHSVKYSPFYRDIVRELSDECRRQGIAFGIYLSPWDRNSKLYGTGKDYDDYFVGQLTELLTRYGDIFEVWFDGACGEGPNGKKQVYDWLRYYKTIRELQPDACIAVCGPDVRWCGNEAGQTRESEWSVVPKRLKSPETVAEKSQREDSAAFRKNPINSMDRDLGSRERMENEAQAVWYPSEVNTSIRPGWFFHESENDRVRSFDELIDIYYKSVGGNAVFLLNLPPDKRGLLHENDCARLKQIGEHIKKTFAVNLAADADFDSDIPGAENVRNDDYAAYFKPDDGVTSARLKVSLKQTSDISHVVLKENILLSQRIERFSVYAGIGDALKKVFSGTVVGYKRIANFAPTEADTVVIEIEDSRVCPTLSFVGVY